MWAFFTSLGLLFSYCNSCIGGFGPLETLGDPFSRGPQGLVPSTSGIISAALCLTPWGGARRFFATFCEVVHLI